MDLILLEDFSNKKKGQLLSNVGYSVGAKLLREKKAKKATLEDLATEKPVKKAEKVVTPVKPKTQKAEKPKAKKQAKK